jgi:F0F1-type ATP synthase assembly protein I
MHLLSLSWEILAFIGLGLLIGWGLDYIFATTPVFIVVCLLLGGIGSFLKTFYMLKKWVGDSDKGD